MTKRLEDAKAHEWKHWKREYECGLMDNHRLNKERGGTPKVREIVFIVGDEKNSREWKREKVVCLLKGKMKRLEE